MTTFSEMASESLEVKAGHAAIFSFPTIASQPAPSVTWQSEVRPNTAPPLFIFFEVNI